MQGAIAHSDQQRRLPRRRRGEARQDEQHDEGKGAGGKEAPWSGFAMGKGGKGEGKDPASQRYVEMNRQIVHSADDKTKFSSFLDHLINDKVKLDTGNIVTILQRGAKLRLSLSAQVVRFLGATLNEAHCTAILRARYVGDALYGLQRLGDSKEARQLVAALTPKVQDCREELDAQAVGNALYGLQRLCDSEEVRQLLAALTPKVQQCREELKKHDISYAISQLVHVSDSDEVRELLFVFLQEGLERAFEKHRSLWI